MAKSLDPGEIKVRRREEIVTPRSDDDDDFWCWDNTGDAGDGDADVDGD